MKNGFNFECGICKVRPFASGLSDEEKRFLEEIESSPQSGNPTDSHFSFGDNRRVTRRRKSAVKASAACCAHGRLRHTFFPR